MFSCSSRCIEVAVAFAYSQLKRSSTFCGSGKAWNPTAEVLSLSQQPPELSDDSRYRGDFHSDSIAVDNIVVVRVSVVVVELTSCILEV